MSSLTLDAASAGPHDLDQWQRGCEAACEEALTWPVWKTTASGARVSSGFISGTRIRSMFWVQELPAEKEARVKSLIFPLAEVGRNAPQWDATFQGADVVATDSPLPDGVELVKWRFKASPLSKRDLLYLLAWRPLTSGAAGGIALYPSVESYPDTSVRGETGKRVRAYNMYPSCDRITHLADGRIQICHLITSRLGGCVPDYVYNTAFAPSVRSNYAHEAEAFHTHVLR
eukprot:CAMPEP_0119377620 /NCGR_PEP_ID=MMETSP1334-20130426/45826_1 /TAXON_ID=127549 /ORGANISM="Calcidiscus leptoporus, Strain RCC1130" /LENGTH=229 /DNA_ID=CAMNT_0007396601 /DNA_START=9 /DNA_END=698 /DNA_ORIENTATION=+